MTSADRAQVLQIQTDAMAKQMVLEAASREESQLTKLARDWNGLHEPLVALARVQGESADAALAALTTLLPDVESVDRALAAGLAPALRWLIVSVNTMDEPALVRLATFCEHLFGFRPEMVLELELVKVIVTRPGMDVLNVPLINEMARLLHILAFTENETVLKELAQHVHRYGMLLKFNISNIQAVKSLCVVLRMTYKYEPELWPVDEVLELMYTHTEPDVLICIYAALEFVGDMPHQCGHFVESVATSLRRYSDHAPLQEAGFRALTNQLKRIEYERIAGDAFVSLAPIATACLKAHGAVAPVAMQVFVALSALYARIIEKYLKSEYVTKITQTKTDGVAIINAAVDCLLQHKNNLELNRVGMEFLSGTHLFSGYRKDAFHKGDDNNLKFYQVLASNVAQDDEVCREHASMLLKMFAKVDVDRFVINGMVDALMAAMGRSTVGTTEILTWLSIIIETDVLDGGTPFSSEDPLRTKVLPVLMKGLKKPHVETIKEYSMMLLTLVHVAHPARTLLKLCQAGVAELCLKVVKEGRFTSADANFRLLKVVQTLSGEYQRYRKFMTAETLEQMVDFVRSPPCSMTEMPIADEIVFIMFSCTGPGGVTIRNDQIPVVFKVFDHVRRVENIAMGMRCVFPILTKMDKGPHIALCQGGGIEPMARAMRRTLQERPDIFVQIAGCLGPFMHPLVTEEHQLLVLAAGIPDILVEWCELDLHQWQEANWVYSALAALLYCHDIHTAPRLVPRLLVCIKRLLEDRRLPQFMGTRLFLIISVLWCRPGGVHGYKERCTEQDHVAAVDTSLLEVMGRALARHTTWDGNLGSVNTIDYAVIAAVQILRGVPPGDARRAAAEEHGFARWVDQIPALWHGNSDELGYLKQMLQGRAWDSTGAKKKKKNKKKGKKGKKKAAGAGAGAGAAAGAGDGGDNDDDDEDDDDDEMANMTDEQKLMVMQAMQDPQMMQQIMAMMMQDMQQGKFPGGGGGAGGGKKRR